MQNRGHAASRSMQSRAAEESGGGGVSRPSIYRAVLCGTASPPAQVEVHLQNLPARCAAGPPARGAAAPATGSPSDMLAGSLTSRPAWPTALSIGLSDTALITILEPSINHDAQDTSYLPAALPTFTAHSHRHT